MSVYTQLPGAGGSGLRGEIPVLLRAVHSVGPSAHENSPEVSASGEEAIHLSQAFLEQDLSPWRSPEQVGQKWETQMKRNVSIGKGKSGSVRDQVTVLWSSPIT